jgi:hypothetical protein
MIEGEPDGSNSFKIELKPGQRVIKKLTRIDNANEAKYKVSLSYTFVA